MFDFEARHVIEALRSGIPSRAVGRYFSEARPAVIKAISDDIDEVCNNRISKGIVISGKYGEGKTHLLNTVFNMAHENNMVVSYLSLSKESPFDKLYLVYQKLVNNTFLPRRQQPGFMHVLEGLTANSSVANEMMLYAAKQLQTDKLYYLLRAYLNTEDQDERFMLQADIGGNFIGNAALKQIYRRIFQQKVTYSVNFSKTKHCIDYFNFLSHLFLQLGYNGWVVLVDETELIGRLGKKARLNAYRNMASFLMPDKMQESTYSMFALGASYIEDVIEAKHERDNLKELFPEELEPVNTVIDLITGSSQLLPLNQDEIYGILKKIKEFHGRAYEWTPDVPVQSIITATEAGGYLLRTKIRAAIEYLDQLYQYGQAGRTQIAELGRESFEEDVPYL